MSGVNDNTWGFQTILANIKKVVTVPFSYQIKGDTDSFRVEYEHNDKYVQPVLSSLNQFGDEPSFEEARIILISAVGATGKSTLAKELSYFLKCPIVDLGCSEVMGGNSLTGIIFKKLDVTEGASFVNNLKAGSATMILDGLDEGFQRTKTQGYYDFLDDVLTMTSDKGKSFILLGRTNAIELAALHFEENNVKTITYQIEPFTFKQAEEFIHLCLKDEDEIDTFSKPYKDLLDYIIKSIGGFFEDRHDVKDKQYERFIGYAPVLLSIAEFLKKNKENYQRVLSEFMKDQLIGTSLVISIVEGILRRDKDIKILPQLIEEKIKGRDNGFQEKARSLAYSFDEQCARVLYRCLDKEYNYPVTGDEAFDLEYTQGIERWIDEHPFLVDKKITNTVFEGYILARLIGKPQFRKDIDLYIEKSKGISYMFFSLYHEMHKEDECLDLSIASYLYSSLKALDNSKKYYTLDLCYDDEVDELTDKETLCELFFEGNEDSELPQYKFNVMLSSSTCLQMHNYLGDVYIDAPIKLSICSSRVLFSAPGYINCKSVDMMTDEIVLKRRQDDSQFVIEAEKVDLLVENTYPNIVADANSKDYFCIVCEDKLTYPLNDYQTIISLKFAKLTPVQREYYKKMRRALIMFRSHSKGEFAKVQSKINNRIGSKPEGKLVLKALLDKGIIYPKERMYFIDKNKMNKYLGLKFDGIRTCVINDKVKEFLRSIS